MMTDFLFKPLNLIACFILLAFVLLIKVLSVLLFLSWKTNVKFFMVVLIMFLSEEVSIYNGKQ